MDPTTTSGDQAGSPNNYLLKWLILYYGNIGIQLRYKQWSDRRSVLNICSNVILNLLVLNHIYLFSDTFAGERAKSPKKSYQALTKLLSTIAEYHFELLLLINGICINFQGNTLYLLMASRPFSLVYRSRYHSIRVFLTTFTVSTVSFLMTIGVFLFDRQSLLASLYQIFCIHLLNFYYIYPWVILNYAKYATLIRMQSLRERLNAAARLRGARMVAMLEDIKYLSRLNRRISQVLTIPMIGFFICLIIDWVFIIYWTDYDLMFVFQTIYMFFVCMYVLYVIYLDTRAGQTFKQIIHGILVKKYPPSGTAHQPPPPTKPSEPRPRARGWRKQQRSSEQKIQIFIEQVRIAEFYDQYVDDFHINLFDICPVDFVFAFDCCLYILAYVVLALQTSID